MGFITKPLTPPGTPPHLAGLKRRRVEEDVEEPATVQNRSTDHDLLDVLNEIIHNLTESVHLSHESEKQVGPIIVVLPSPESKSSPEELRLLEDRLQQNRLSHSQNGLIDLGRPIVVQSASKYAGKGRESCHKRKRVDTQQEEGRATTFQDYYLQWQCVCSRRSLSLGYADRR